jgi:hypothetical protein
MRRLAAGDPEAAAPPGAAAAGAAPVVAEPAPSGTDEALVRCPGCGAQGRVTRLELDLASVAQLVCPACGLRWRVDLHGPRDAARWRALADGGPAAPPVSAPSPVPGPIGPAPEPGRLAATTDGWAARVRAQRVVPLPATTLFDRHEVVAAALVTADEPGEAERIIGRLQHALVVLDGILAGRSHALPTLDGGSPVRVVWREVSELHDQLELALRRSDPGLDHLPVPADPWPVDDEGDAPR